jgi:pimeloyl-ACP methyl ester carboxylesterase
VSIYHLHYCTGAAGVAGEITRISNTIGKAGRRQDSDRLVMKAVVIRTWIINARNHESPELTKAMIDSSPMIAGALGVLTAFLVVCGGAAGQDRTREVVRHDGVAIEVVAEGRGPLIVLLSSLGRDADEFDAAAEQIAAAGFRVVRPQPRGYGRSAGPMEKLTLHDFARDIAAVIRHENAGPAILAGHAYGHFVAKMTAVDFPELTRGVVLIGAAEKKPDPEVQRSVALATDPTQPEEVRLKHLRTVFFAPGNDATLWLTGFHAAVRGAQVIARDSTPQAEYWSAGTAPILDIQGADDPYRPPSSRSELVEEFGPGRVSTALIQHAAHAIMVEQPRAVADAIIAWARRL